MKDQQARSAEEALFKKRNEKGANKKSKDDAGRQFEEAVAIAASWCFQEEVLHSQQVLQEMCLCERVIERAVVGAYHAGRLRGQAHSHCHVLIGS